MTVLVSVPPVFDMLVGINSRGTFPDSGSLGINNKDVELRRRFQVQQIKSVVAGAVISTVPGGKLNTDGGILVATATFGIEDNDFSGGAKIVIGEFVLEPITDFVVDAGIAATATVTVKGPMVGGETITIGGTVLSNAGAPRSSGSDDWDGTLGSDILIADDIVAAINDVANSFAVTVSADNGGTAVVTITAVVPGTAGNSITLTSNDGVRLAVSGNLGSVVLGVNPVRQKTAINIVASINNLPGFSATAPGLGIILIEGKKGPQGCVEPFSVTSLGAVDNFAAVDPVLGFFTEGEPAIGPPGIV